jgi:hydrogenase nickel incorporation protein HypA/HybF
MHELSIAISMIEVAAEQLEAHCGGDARIDAIHLKLGPLSGVVKEALLGAFELAREGTPLAGARLLIEDVPVTILCPRCRGPRAVESIQEMRCRACGTPSADVLTGRELEVFALEICDEQPAATA